MWPISLDTIRTTNTNTSKVEHACIHIATTLYLEVVTRKRKVKVGQNVVETFKGLKMVYCTAVIRSCM